MYTPSSDQKHGANEHEYVAGKSKKHSAIPPRQSAVPYTFVAKQPKPFYTDEHPEVPKIRRASLKPSSLELEDEQASSETVPPISKKLSGKTRAPFSNPTTKKHPVDSQLAPYPRHTRKKAQQTMLPLAGLDSTDEIQTWQRETGSFKRPVPARKPVHKLPPDEPGPDEHDDEPVPPEKSLRLPPITKQTEQIPVLVPPQRWRGTFTASTKHLYRLGQPWLHRKRTWIGLGLLGMVLLILVPLLFYSMSVPTHNATQKYTIPNLPNIPTNPHELVITPPNTDHPAPPLFAKSAYLLDTDHEATLYVQNPFLHLPMLSTTKLMTASLAVEEGNLDQSVTISPLMQQEINQLSADSALFGVKQGQTYTLRDLLYGLLYFSGNDAALVIANVVGGNVSHFVAEMNQKAQSLGMHDTHFVNPHGLLDDGQYSCAHDLAILGQYSLSIPILQQISGARTYYIPTGGNHPARMLVNENQFLWWYPGTTGGKTGYDGVSDFVQVMSVTRDNHHLIGVVMHTNNWWTDMRDLMDYGSTDYTWASPRDTEAAGHPVVYDNLWHYFVSDTPRDTISMGAQSRYYVYTGYTVSGLILAYFDQHGGLTAFGYPIKMSMLSEQTLITQQFQHGSLQCDTASQQCHLL